MVRRSTLIFAALALCLAPALAKRKSSSSSKRMLRLVSFDLAARQINVEIQGRGKPPPSNYFSITDDRGRHFVAQGIHCEPPAKAVRACALEIPSGYERHPIVAIELHLRGLHGRTIGIRGEEVSAAYAAAQAASNSSTPDGGTTSQP
jgi:hypothetical protein